jgi:hypothetical protein
LGEEYRSLCSSWWSFLFSLQLLPETFLILRRNERDVTKSV